MRKWILKFPFLLFSSIPEIVFWHIPSTAYVEAGPSANQPINPPCVGSINDENVAPQEAEHGIMESLTSRSSVKVRNSSSLVLPLSLLLIGSSVHSMIHVSTIVIAMAVKLSAIQYIEDDPKH